MTEYLEKIISSAYIDKGKKLNKLIEYGVIDVSDVIDEIISDKEKSLLATLPQYVKLSKEDVLALAREIIKRGNSSRIYFFAKEIEDAPVSLLEEAIIKLKEPYYIYLFARNVKGADISKLEKAIIETENYEYVYSFARDIKGVNTPLLLESLIKLQNSEYLFKFIVNILGYPKREVEEVLLNINDMYYQKYLAFKKEYQDKEYEKLNNSLNNNDTSDIISNRESYSYLFKEVKIKKLIKEND